MAIWIVCVRAAISHCTSRPIVPDPRQRLVEDHHLRRFALDRIRCSADNPSSTATTV
jgi:hypothetical protein